MRMHALFSSRLRFSRALLLVGLILFSCVSAREVAAEIVVSNNDSNPTSILIVATQVGDRFATRLTAPIDGNIVGVQFFWGSKSGGTAPSQESAIRISAADGPVFENTTIPQPGSVLATIESPVLFDLTQQGSITSVPNEFRFIDSGTNQVPINIPVLAGEAFYVELELANVYPYDFSISQGFEPGSPGLFMSTRRLSNDAFQSIGHMPEFPLEHPPTYWYDVSEEIFFGIGAWGIRAIIQPVPEPSTYVLAAIGVVGLLAFRRRKSVA